jgi:hypothetical protein
MGGVTFIKWLALCLIILTAGDTCTAQQKFPLRNGEWTSTVPDPTNPAGQPMTMLFCMNDQTWAKALNHNAACTIQAFNVTSGGGSYSMVCNGKAFQMKGNFKLTFDGMTHMTSSGTLEMTMGGKTSQMVATTDFRWKSATCNPNVDMNLRDHSKPPQ